MRELYAARAVRAYAAMQRGFHARGGRYRRDGWFHLPCASAHLWPFARALVATLDLAGIGDGLIDGIDAEAEIADRLHQLERYWDPDRPLPAYSSDPGGSSRYYDDNAWVALALIEHARLRPGAGSLARAEELFRFALGGWAPDASPYPGGVFWVEQGRGAGKTNHDRNTVSNAPNACVGLHIQQLTGTEVRSAAGIGAPEMYEWVLAALDASRGTDSAGTGLFWDKVQGDGRIDRALWSYNQGSMVGANVLLARGASDGGTTYLARAAAIARKALTQFAGSYEAQPAEFNAIFFRNLLLLHDATEDQALRDQVIGAMRGYADWAGAERKDGRDRFHLRGGVTLLGQSAMVQVLSLLAWNPAAYGLIA